MTTKKIDIESLYSKLKTALEKRAGYQEAQDNLWKYIKKTKENKKDEMNKISEKIGENTHEINIILNELTKYKKTHKAMNIAYNYLLKEIERTKLIIDKWKKAVKDVEEGRSIFIKATGENDTNTEPSKKYIQKKSVQLINLQNWLNHVQKYIEK